MRLTELTAALVLAALLAGCNGPKDSCHGSFESYFSDLKGKDYAGTWAMLIPEHRKKYPLERYERMMAEMWDPVDGMKVQLGNVAEAKNKTCIVNGLLDYTFRVRGQMPEDVDDEYFSWTFRKLADGKWYIEMPGSEKLSGW